MLASLVIAALAAGPAERVGRLDHRGIAEPSGIVASRRHPGILWVHNDSGNPPALFAVRRDGTLVREYRVDAVNLDWEDLAIDDAGHLYIGDVGNNLRALPVRVIHRVDEPDPSEPAPAALKVSASYHFTYPAPGAFDCEGLFVDGDRAVLVSKRPDGREAELYAVPLEPNTLLKPAKAERIAALRDFTRPATGAGLSPDGRWLAVCAVGEVRLYRRDADGRWLPAAKMKGPGGQVEAIGWDGADLVLANEERALFRIAEKSWRAQVRPKGGKR